MNIKINFALPPWWIVLLQKPLHSPITHGWLLHTPPPPMVLLRYNRRSSIPISALQSGSALQYCIQHSILHFSQYTSSGMGTPHLDQECLYFIPVSLPVSLSAMLSLDGLLRWIGVPWPEFAPPNFIPHFSITIITPLTHPALHIRHSSFSDGAPLFSANSSYCLSNSILIHHKLSS